VVKYRSFVTGWNTMRTVLGVTGVAASLFWGGHAAGLRRADGQSINAGVATAVKKGHVDFLADGQSVPANQPATVKLHFRVDPGFHINSHTPKSDVLIPTRLTVAMVGDDPEVTGVDFPAGEPFAFAFEPKQKLDVYHGDVVLTAHLKAKPGQHSIKAELYYQACDQAACYPPKKLPVEQPYTAR
jgi:thiol:disulfide interchange protein